MQNELEPREKAFIAALDKAIAFHQNNKFDTYNIGNAVATALREVQLAFIEACNAEP